MLIGNSAELEQLIVTRTYCGTAVLAAKPYYMQQAPEWQMFQLMIGIIAFKVTLGFARRAVA